MKYRNIKQFLIICLAAMVCVGCQSSNAVKGSAIGGSAGGVLGGLIAGKDNTAKGVIIGAAIGGSAGAIIGNQMDKQAEELKEDLEGADIERVGEGIKITFDSGLMFNLNSSDLNTKTKQNLRELAEVLNKYEDTNVLIEGHTDASGSADYNQKLSGQRAESVLSYLVSMGVDFNRLDTQAYGETQPIADNDTQTGRQANRRVEVAIYANDKMKRLAKKGELGRQ